MYSIESTQVTYKINYNYSILTIRLLGQYVLDLEVPVLLGQLVDLALQQDVFLRVRIMRDRVVR